MAFVYRSEPLRKDKDPNLGPGAYNHQKASNAKNSGFAPFSSLVERFPTGKNPNPEKAKKPEFNVPGPGAYSVSKDLVGEKVLVSNAQNDMKIIEVPKESSVFKSKTEKMTQPIETKDLTPGPGYYTKENDYFEKSSGTKKDAMFSVFLSTNQEKKSAKHPNLNFVEGIKSKETNYKLIPSIPGRKEAFGYTESESRELNLNNNPMIKFSGVGEDKIGPGQYEAKDSMKERGYSWWKSNSKRIAGLKSQTLDVVGPGSYNPSLEIRNVLKAKPTSAFLSKIERTFEVGKQPNKYNELLQKKLSSSNTKVDEQAQNTVSDDGGPFTISAFEEQMLREKMNTVEPGPGHYHSEKLRSSLNIGSKPVPKQNFGSSDLRFKDDMRPTVGPGDYNPKIDLNPHKVKPRVKIPFISGIQRFENNSQEIDLGPGSYNPQLSLENDLIKKIQNGYKGNFGSLEKRFDERKEKKKNKEIPGPGNYLPAGAAEVKLEKNKGSVFKSKSERKPFEPQDQNPGIGTYELDYYNLNSSFNKDVGYEPFVIVKKPPFNSSEPRFVKGLDSISSDSQMRAEVSTLSTGSQGTKDPHKNNSSIMNIKNNPSYQMDRKFNIKAKRFNYKSEETPGPGKYSAGGSWNKKTFNILFAEL